jgi:hypothetical protein
MEFCLIVVEHLVKFDAITDPGSRTATSLPALNINFVFLDFFYCLFMRRGLSFHDPGVPRGSFKELSVGLLSSLPAKPAHRRLEY